MLNEIRYVNNIHNNQCTSEFSMRTNVADKKINVAISDDLTRLESLTSNAITPHATSPIPDKMPSTFVVLLKEHLKHEHHKYSGYGKLTREKAGDETL